MDQDQILAKLNELEVLFLNGEHTPDKFYKYLTQENMQNPIISARLIELLNMGAIDPHHEEKPFEYGKYKFMVDAELYDLIGLLYELGIRTKFSCQGDAKHEGYILFKNRRSFIKFTKVCKAMHLVEMDVIGPNGMDIITDLDQDIPDIGNFSVRFKNENIGLIYNSIKKVSTKSARNE